MRPAGVQVRAAWTQLRRAFHRRSAVRPAAPETPTRNAGGTFTVHRAPCDACKRVSPAGCSPCMMSQVAAPRRRRLLPRCAGGSAGPCKTGPLRLASCTACCDIIWRAGSAPAAAQPSGQRTRAAAGGFRAGGASGMRAPARGGRGGGFGGRGGQRGRRRGLAWLPGVARRPLRRPRCIPLGMARCRVAAAHARARMRPSPHWRLPTPLERRRRRPRRLWRPGWRSRRLRRPRRLQPRAGGPS